MPFITCKVNRPVSREQEVELKSRMGKAIELVPGKSEEYLLLAFGPDSRLWLRGDDSQPMACIDAAIFGNEGYYGYPEFTAEVTRAFGEVLGIPAGNVYIKFEDITAGASAGSTSTGAFSDERQDHIHHLHRSHDGPDLRDGADL